MATLRKVPGLTEIVRKVNSVGLDRLVHMECMANSVRVGPRQFPTLYRVFQEVCDTVGVSGVDLFVQQQFALNAFTMGVERPMVVVTTQTVQQMAEDELRFILGHELGHVKSEHVLFLQIGAYLPMLMSVVGQLTLGLGRLVGAGFELALYDWCRKAEFSADRVGLLAVQDLHAARRAFYKLAGVPASLENEFSLQEISRQAAEFEQYTKESFNSFFRFWGQATRTHPWIVPRVAELEKWIESGQYRAVLSMGTSEGEQAGWTCPVCGKRLPLSLLSCVYCGYPDRQS